MSERTVSVTDRRVRKTRHLLRLCLTELLKIKKIQDISVKEIADMADINRGTFYLHYRDIFDMLGSIEQEMFDEFDDILKHYSLAELHKHPYALLEEIFRFVRENQDMTQVLLGPNGDITFSNSMKELLKDRIFTSWKELFRTTDTEMFEAFYSYIIGGCFGLMEHWFNTGLKLSPKQMAKITENFIMEGMKGLE